MPPRRGEPLLGAPAGSDGPADRAAARSEARVACLRCYTAVFGAGTFALPGAFARVGPPLGLAAVVVAGLLSRLALSDLLDSKAERESLLREGRPAPLGDSRPQTAEGGGLTELAVEVLGPPAALVTWLLLVLRSAGLAAAHASLAAEVLRPWAQAACDQETGEGWGPLCGVAAEHLRPAVLLLAAALLCCLQARTLAPLGIVGVAALTVAVLTEVVAAGLAWPREGRGWLEALQLQLCPIGRGGFCAGHGAPHAPPTLAQAVDALGVAAFLFCMHFAVLPPVLNGLTHPGGPGPRQASREAADALARWAFRGTAGLNIVFALLGAPLSRQLTLASTEAAPAPVPAWLPRLARAALGAGGVALCPSVLAPAVEMSRLALPRLPRCAACAVACCTAAVWARAGGLEEVTALVGSTVQCLLALVVPASLALWTMPWQTARRPWRTTRRVGFILAGVAMVAASVYALSRPLFHRG